MTLKAACFLDQSTFRTKAVNEGIKAGLGAAQVTVQGNLKGFKDILDEAHAICMINLECNMRLVMLMV